MTVFLAFVAVFAGLALAGLYWEIVEWREARRTRRMTPPDAAANSRPLGNVTPLPRDRERSGTDGGVTRP